MTIEGTETPRFARWSPDDGIDKVLVVTALPDDVDFGAAGTVAAMTSAGIEVAYCICTNGDAGGSDRSISRAEMAVIRQREQRAAAARVGVETVVFLGHPDGRLQASIELRRDVSRQIRLFRPGRVITQSPERLFDRIYASHPDHLAAGEAALCAVYPDARNPFAHPELLADEGLEPHTVGEVWLMSAPAPDVIVDIGATFDAKVAALGSHASQLAPDFDAAKLLRQFAESVAAVAELGDGGLAEAFRLVATA